jgi:hypothetical protein
MEFEKVQSSHFTHGLHNRFVVEMKYLFLKYTPTPLDILIQVEILGVSIVKENGCYNIIRKNDFSELKEEADGERDRLLTGLGKNIRTATDHFKPEVKEAAKRIKNIYDAYNRSVPMVNQPYDAETASIENFLTELNEKHADDMKIIGITEWVEELALVNTRFDKLVKASNEQQARKTEFRMVKVRKEVDKDWKNIMTLIKADIIRNGEENYRDFIAEWNELAKHYNDIWAQHQGRNKAKRAKAKKAQEEKEKKEQAEKEQSASNKEQGTDEKNN